MARAGCQEPLRREQARGPQHQVKPAASTDLQPESRAAHVTAKAMIRAHESGEERAGNLGGVRGAARVQGTRRNTRGPSARPESGQAGSYKPMAKSSGAQRESEGTGVVTRAVKNNAVGAKGPCGGRAGEAGKREGMAGKTGPNNPGGREPADKVRQLQRRLWSAAKRHPGRRFHALYDRIHRSDVLWEAWKRVKRNRGAATVRDRVAQMAAKLVLEPIFEARFCASSYGFRPKRSATMALEALRERGARGGNHVLDADIRDYFGSIDHDKLMKLVERRVSDRRVLKLLRQWLRAGVMDEGVLRENLAGTPQGGVISPLLSNIYLHVLDAAWEREGAQYGLLVRYADDFVVMCDTRAQVERAEGRVGTILARLGLELHPEKTRTVELARASEGFDFLGCHLRKRMSGPVWEKQHRRVYFLQRWPSQRAMKRIRGRVKELTPRAACHRETRETIALLNPVLRGWGGYFRTGNAAVKFGQIDTYVCGRLQRLLRQRKGRQVHQGERAGWTPAYFQALGLHRLRGTIHYPGVA